MSTTTNMHAITKIEVAEFPDHNPPFVSVKIHDAGGNMINLFPIDLDQFVRDVRIAAADARTVKGDQ